VRLPEQVILENFAGASLQSPILFITSFNFKPMKNSFALLLGGLLFCTFAAAQAADHDAIKKVCYDESMAFHALDFEKWASYHTQSADEQLAWNNPDGSFGFESGWDKIGTGMKDWFKTAEKEVIKLSNSNFIIVIHGDMAFAAYDSEALNSQNKTMKMREYRTLLRVGGQWKILAVQAFANHLSGK